MNLQFRTELGAPYKAGSQIARVLTEDWVGRELYCAACDCDSLSASKPNTPAVDFACNSCEEVFQLKSLKNCIPAKIVDSGYDAMMRAILQDKTPNLLILEYSPDWFVRNLLLVPRVFFTKSVIERRNPLSPEARRAGWVGCNILLSDIPDDGKIQIISAGSALPKRQVRSEFSRVRGLGALPPLVRGWALDVLRVVRRIGTTRFSLLDVYKFDHELRAAHPRNKNIRPKIRQQLQVLRDLGLVEFTSPGKYLLRTAP